jgi:hypothetical protein
MHAIKKVDVSRIHACIMHSLTTGLQDTSQSAVSRLNGQQVATARQLEDWQVDMRNELVRLKNQLARSEQAHSELANAYDELRRVVARRTDASMSYMVTCTNPLSLTQHI